jgi:hypothetical protein
MKSVVDKFGNLIVDCRGIFVDIPELCNNVKAVLLKNVSPFNIITYNAHNAHNPAVYQTNRQNDCYNNVYLIKNNTSCPELVNGKLYRGGINIIVQRQNRYYTLLVKDKTKNYLTCPGGTYNGNHDLDNRISADPNDIYSSEHDLDNHIDVIHYNVATRKLTEETTGINKSIKPLRLNNFQIFVNCTFSFKSFFFDIPNVRDSYVMGRYFVNLDDYKCRFQNYRMSDHVMLKENAESLSDILDIAESSSGKVIYENNDNIDYIRVVELHSTFESILSNNIPKEERHPFTNLHISATIEHLNNILHMKHEYEDDKYYHDYCGNDSTFRVCNNMELLTSALFPKNLLRYRAYQYN